MPGKDLVICASARALALVEHARGMLAEARDLTDVKTVIGKAEALRHYLKQQGEAVESQNLAAEIKIRAERRAGELLREMPKNEGSKGSWAKGDGRLHDATAREPTLESIGIEKTQSHRWQAVASIPDDVFERHVSTTRTSGKPLTSNGTLQLAKQILAAGDRSPREVKPSWRLDDAVIELITTIREIFDAWPEGKRPILGAKLRDLGVEILETGGMPE